MTRILIQKFINGQPQFDRVPRLYKDTIEMEIPAGFDLIVIERTGSDSFSILGIAKDFEGEAIELS